MTLRRGSWWRRWLAFPVSLIGGIAMVVAIVCLLTADAVEGVE